MGNLTSFVQTALTGGEVSKSAQGRMDLPSYKISMNVCLNGIPVETGAWQRRPGTRHVAPARGGKTGRLIAFAFEDNFPYQMEFTDGFLRFTTGPALVMTNDQQAVSAISTANPAVVQTALAHGWASGNSVAFNSLGANNPLLQNRQFLITVVDTTHFSLADAITGAAINGSTLGTFVSGNVTRILEIATSYTTGSWASLRSVQAETRSLLLNGSRPQVLQVATKPSLTQFATFTYGPANFVDGPYLDPIKNSVVTSGALDGVVTLTFTFAAWVSTAAYNVGDFVTSVGICYESLTALNQNNTPASSPSNWAPVNGGAAVNGGNGFIASDIGRLIRLYSEPPLWAVASTYSTGNVVSYPSGSGGNSYWTATGSIAAGVQPGTSTSWALNATGATWTWAQIVSVSGAGLINPATAIGSLSGGGGLAAAFDGNTTKGFSASASSSSTITTYPVWSATNYSSGSFVEYAGVGYQCTITIVSGTYNVWDAAAYYAAGALVQYQGFVYDAIFSGTNHDVPPAGQSNSSTYWRLIAANNTLPPPYAGVALWTNLGVMPQPHYDLYVGQNLSGGGGSKIQFGTLFSTSDIGLENNGATVIVNLMGKTTAPSSASDGTLLGTTGPISNPTTSVSITSTDQSTTYNYVWFEIVVAFLPPLPDDGSHVFTAKVGVAQAQFFSTNVANGSVVTAQIRGPALLYSATISTWQLGVYSDTTGWPTCGAYYQGRIFLGGVVNNRFDACVSNGLNGTVIDFTPTAPNGTVSDNNSISYICDGEDSNQILWMVPEQQGMLFGSKAGEWLISAPSPGAITPTNISAARVTKIGCAAAEPRRAEHTLLFIQKFGRKVMEYFADVFSGKFTAPDLAERAKHLSVNGIAEIAYQQELAPTLWARRSDGLLVGATYKRDTLMTSQGPNIIGWHRHQLGSGRLVESISVGPSIGGNLENLSIITNDPSTGVRHIELMTDLLDEGFQLTNCWFLDDGIAPSSTVVQTATALNPFGTLLVNGLSVHEGKTVTAFIAGLDCGDFVVSAGSITIPFGDGVSGGTGNGLFTQALAQSFTVLPAVVGFTYNSDGQLLRPVTPADSGAQAGPGFAKLGRQHRVAAQLYGAVNGSISFGTDFVTMYPAKLRFANDVPYPVNQLWSGIYRDNVNSIIDFDGMITWRISRPLPAFVIAVGGFDTKADA